MTKTGTQNRPYNDQEKLMVKATFRWDELVPGTDDGGLVGGSVRPRKETLTFNWNDRVEVRNFAAQSDRIIRMGGSTLLEQVEA